MEIIKRSVRARFLALLAIVGVLAVTWPVKALNNGVGLTPAMGYNPWNSFLVTPTLDTLKEIIDSLVSNGMRDAGYVYMCHDGGPFRKEPDSVLQKFVDYGHRKGLKIGVYANKDCRGIEDSIAKKWARMGVDYFKHDDFWTPWDSIPTYFRMRDALKETRNPIYYTIHAANFAPRPDTICNAMRVGSDINVKKDSLNWGPTSKWDLGVMGEVMASRGREHLARPGYFNDMDMMGVGMRKFISNVEAQTHFNFWCIMASLLLEGSDIRHIDSVRLAILLNREVIAVNQDSLGQQGRVVWSRYRTRDSSEIICKLMKDSSRAVMLFNRYSTAPKSITVRLDTIGLTGPVFVRDLVRHENLPIARDSVTILNITHHGSAMLRISKNPITSVFPNKPIAAEKKSYAAHAPTVRLCNTRITSKVELLAGYCGLEIFNLQGAKIWEMHRDRTEVNRGVRIPGLIKNAGTVVIRFVK